jgi:hypothetical protein
MTSYFYTDANGQKQGPVSKRKLRTLAILGTIEPNTPIETNTGVNFLAAQIPSLWDRSLAKNEDEEPVSLGGILTIFLTIIVCVVVILAAPPLAFIALPVAMLFLLLMGKLFKIESHLKSIREHYENE